MATAPQEGCLRNRILKRHETHSMPTPDANTILVLLGEPVLTDLTCYRLELLGYDVQKVKTGDTASNAIDNGGIGLVILDTSLQEGDGLVWLSEMRRRVTGDRVPVMIVSLDPSLDTVRRAFEAGAQDYLITPFDPIVLEQKVAAFVESNLLGHRGNDHFHSREKTGQAVSDSPEYQEAK